MKQPFFRVIIAGSCAFSDYDLLCRKCDSILSGKLVTHNIIIVSGTARGADTLGERYARERGYAVRRFPADWKQYGRAAGPIRNSEMARNADALVAFWNGRSSGTRDMLAKAKKQGLPIRTILY